MLQGVQIISLIGVILLAVATISLGIYVQRSVRSAADMYVASRSVSVSMNSAAISGEYLSAASFMGVAGMVMKTGYDSIWYPVGYAAGYLLLLLFIASPMRRFGAYTIPDFAEGRFDSPTFRKAAVILVLFIGFFYTMPQMKGAGTAFVNILDTPYWVGIVVVGSVVTINVALGGMKGITLIQAFQYWLKLMAISIPVFIMFVFLGGYGTNLAKFHNDPVKGAALPVFRNDYTAIYKPAPPLNNIIFPTNIRGTFQQDTMVIITPSDRLLMEADHFETQNLMVSPLPLNKREVILSTGEKAIQYLFRKGEAFETGKHVKFTVHPAGANPDTRITFQAGQPVPNAPDDKTWLEPYGLLTSGYGYPVLYTYSLIIAVVFGTAGLPHILVRFYTNPDGRAAKKTTFWVIVLLGLFYLFPPVLGAMGRAWVPELYSVAGGARSTDSVVLILPRLLNQSVPYLGDILAAVTAMGAFAAFMTTFSGLLVSITSALAHDVYYVMINPRAVPSQEVSAFRVFGIVSGVTSIILGLFVENFDINMMVGWAFAIGAASYFPMIFLSIWWRKCTAIGAGAGMMIGGGAALAAIVSTMLADKMVIPALALWFSSHPVIYTLCVQPAIWAVPFSLMLIIVISKLTPKLIPAKVGWKMLVLHAPDEVALKNRNYISEGDRGN